MLDQLVNCVVLNSNSGEALTVRRILNTQAPLFTGVNESLFSQQGNFYLINEKFFNFFRIV